ncbi:MAG: PEGA domain-containing protein [Sandaracinaceae bacterium]
MRRTLGSSVLGVLIALSAMGPRAAVAQDDETRERARENFEAGVARFEAGDFQGALERFQEAYRIAPHPSVRVNMANCYERLDRPLEALHHFEGFLAEAESPTPQQRREVQAAIQRLRAQLGDLRLTIAPDGAQVTIDGEQVLRAPILQAVTLARGVHVIEVQMDGFEPERQEIRIAGGDTQRVSVRLSRADPAAVAVVDPVADPEGDPVTDPVGDEGTDDGVDAAAGGPTGPDDGSTYDSGGWRFRLTAPVVIAGVATILFAATAITCGILALDFNQQFEDQVARFNSATTVAEQNAARNEGLSAADAANTTSILTDVFLIGTIAAGAATIFFLIVEGMGADEDEAMSARVLPAFAFGREGGSAGLVGTF